MLSIAVLLLLAASGASAIRDQSIAVTGKLVCGSKPAANVRIKLWEEDSGPDPDDLLDQGYTGADGSFRLGGGTAELTPIDPVFKIYHDCDDGILPGSRKVKFGLPKSYITEGKEPKKTFDIGVLNLETVFAKEEREMIVSRRRREGVNADYLDDTKMDEKKHPKDMKKEKKVSSSESKSAESADSEEDKTYFL